MKLLILQFIKEFNGSETCHFNSVGARRPLTMRYLNTENGKLQCQWPSSLFVVLELPRLDAVITFLNFPVPSTENSPSDAEICFRWATDN